jgi:hypothetical protein
VQVFISKYALAAHLSILTVAPLVLLAYFTPVVQGEVMLWLSFITFIWAICNPSRRKGELLHTARKRVFSLILQDPLFWGCIFLVCFSLVRWLNASIELEYNLEETKWMLSKAVVPYFPSARKDVGFFEFASSIAFGIIVLSVKYCLGKRARSFYLVFTAFVASLLALSFFLGYVCDVEKFIEMAKCSRAVSSNVGVAFFLYAIAALFAIPGCIEVQWGRNIFFLMLSIATLLISAFIYSSAFEILTYSIAFLVGLLILSGSSVFYYSVVASFKFSISAVSSLALVVIVVLSVLPSHVMAQKVPYLFGQGMIPENVTAERNILSDISLRIWSNAKWLGGGLGSYPLELKFAATVSDFQTISLTQACPLNGYWQLICENGLVGVFVYAVILILGISTLFFRIIKAVIRVVRGSDNEASFIDYASSAFLLPFLIIIPISVSAMLSSSFMRNDVILPLGAFLALGISSIRSEYSLK